MSRNDIARILARHGQGVHFANHARAAIDGAKAPEFGHVAMDAVDRALADVPALCTEVEWLRAKYEPTPSEWAEARPDDYGWPVLRRDWSNGSGCARVGSGGWAVWLPHGHLYASGDETDTAGRDRADAAVLAIVNTFYGGAR